MPPTLTFDQIRDRVLETETGCWEWQGSRRNGYGRVMHQRRVYSTHRLFYERLVGPIPDGVKVLHHCDNPPCCNPHHLFLGTQTDNMRDMATKGRSRESRGAANPRARLSATQVENIRGLLGRVPQRELASWFGVSKSTIGEIARGATWHEDWAPTVKEDA